MRGHQVLRAIVKLAVCKGMFAEYFDILGQLSKDLCAQNVEDESYLDGFLMETLLAMQEVKFELCKVGW